MGEDLLLAGDFWGTGGRYLWHVGTRTAVLADVHLGVERQLRAAGIFMPDITMDGIRPAWRELVARGPRRVVIAGDLFDSGEPDGETIGVALGLMRALPTGCEVTVVRGNHDPSVGVMREIFETGAVEVVDATRVGKWVVAHGHELSEALEETGEMAGLIVGHQHPAVVLGDRVQRVKMMCYATCGVKRVGGGEMTMIVLPAFSHAPLGSSLMNEGQWNLDCARPGDEGIQIAGIVSREGGARVLDFGWLSGLRELG